MPHYKGYYCKHDVTSYLIYISNINSNLVETTINYLSYNLTI